VRAYRTALIGTALMVVLGYQIGMDKGTGERLQMRSRSNEDGTSSKSAVAMTATLPDMPRPEERPRKAIG